MNDDINNDDIEYRLSQLLDGTLPPEQRAELEQRLAEDDALRRQLEEYRRLQTHLDGLTDLEPLAVDYPQQRREIMGAIERRALLAPRGSRLRRWSRAAMLPASAAAAAVLIAAMVYFYGFPEPPGAAPGEPMVSARLVPFEGADAHGGEMKVKVARLGFEETPLAGPKERRPSPVPPGTVLVSFGAEQPPRAQYVSSPVPVEMD